MNLAEMTDYQKVIELTRKIEIGQALTNMEMAHLQPALQTVSRDVEKSMQNIRVKKEDILFS